VLLPLKRVIQFPPGSTILIPSGCLEHGNTPIQNGEVRLSIAQYAAGGLFRWVAYGFRSAKSLLAGKNGAKIKNSIDLGDNIRWLEGLDMFSKAEELELDWKAVYHSS